MRHAASARRVVGGAIAAAALIACNTDRDRKSDTNERPANAPVEPPTPASPPVAAEPAPPAAPPPEFSLALLRDGPLHLRAAGDRAFLLLDGESLPLGPEGPVFGDRPADTAALRGADAWNSRPLAYAETPDGRDAWLVLGHTNSRAGGLRDVGVHRRVAGRWTAVPTGGPPGLLEYYAPLIVRGDTILGLRDATIDSDAKNDEGEALRAAEEALARSTREFVRLSGSSADALPAIPDRWTVGDVAVSTDGTIFGLAHDQDRSTTAVLAWSRERSEPDAIPLPSEARGARLTVTGRCLLLAGSPRYLLVARSGALAHGDPWRRIAVELPDDLGDRLGPALCTDTGELWLTLTTEGSYGPERRLAHRSPDGTWTPITLPPPDERLAPERRWVFDGADGWLESQPQRGHAEPYIEGLAWAEQRLWVLVDFGRLIDVSSGNWLSDSRKALYVGGPLARPVILPGRREPALAHATRDRRSPGDCSTFVIALGVDARADALSDEQRAALRALAPTGDDGGVELLYVGESGGRRELVVQASAYDRASATTLARKVGKAIGARVKADCRARRLIEAVESMREQ